MQVSWIDADRLKELVEQIAPQGGGREATPCVTEIETAPEPLPGPPAESWGFAMDWEKPPAPPAPVAALNETFVAEPEPQAEMEDETDDDEHRQPVPNPAAALPLSRIRDKLRAIRQRASDAGILTRISEITPPELSSQRHITEPAPAEVDEGAAEADRNQENSTIKEEPHRLADSPQTPAFDIPQGSREARLAAFADWAKLMVREDDGQILVMSDDGEVLWGGAAKAGLVLSTMMAWGAALRASALSACETPSVIHQPLSSGNVLTVIPCETAVGMVHVAVDASLGVPHELAEILRGALCAAMV